MGGFATIWVAFSGSYMVADRLIVRRWALPDPWATLIEGIAPAVLGLCAALMVERRMSNTSVRESLRNLGFGLAPRSAIAVALLSALPIVGFYVIRFGWQGVPVRTVDGLPLQVGKFVLAQGVFEQVLFQGVLFRRLRVGRSFFSAATISAAVFSLSHLANLVHGLTVAVLVRVGISLVFAAVLAYPAAYLFERGRNTIWAFGLLHLAIDSVDWFVGIAGSTAMYIYLGAVAISAGCVFGFGALLLPRRPTPARQ